MGLPLVLRNILEGAMDWLVHRQKLDTSIKMGVVELRDCRFMYITKDINSEILDKDLEIVYPQPQQAKTKMLFTRDFPKYGFPLVICPLLTSCLNANQIQTDLIHV